MSSSFLITQGCTSCGCLCGGCPDCVHVSASFPIGDEGEMHATVECDLFHSSLNGGIACAYINGCPPIVTLDPGPNPPAALIPELSIVKVIADFGVTTPGFLSCPQQQITWMVYIQLYFSGGPTAQVTGATFKGQLVNKTPGVPLCPTFPMEAELCSWAPSGDVYCIVDQIICPSVLGACCTPLPGGANNCAVRFATCCEGEFFPGQSCLEVDCQVTAQACCLPSGLCMITTPAGCLAQGGTVPGFGTCVGVNCPPPITGACCKVDGTCEDLSSINCSAIGGYWMGAGTVCASLICETQTGACCRPDGTCFDSTLADCNSQLGTWRGNGTSCGTMTTPCPATIGRCCLQTGVCLPGVTLEHCNSVHGQWSQGSCGLIPNPCHSGPPLVPCCYFEPNGQPACVNTESCEICQEQLKGTCATLPCHFAGACFTGESYSIPRITTQEAYDALKSGRMYIDPEGNKRRKL